MFANIYETYCLRKYHTGIHTFPVTSYFRMSEKKDFKYLLRTGFVKVDRFALVAYEKISDQIIDEFGVNPDFKTIFEKKVQIELLYAEQFKIKRTTNQVQILILEEEIKTLEKPKKSTGTIYDGLISIEKAMGLKFEFEKISVFDFFTYAKHLNKK